MPIIKHAATVRRKANREYDKSRGTARQRGYSAKWDKFARAWLVSHPLCEYCASAGRITVAELVDHIVPHRGDIDAFWPGEGQDPSQFFAASCKPCHDGPKQRAEARAAKTGKDVRTYLVRWGMLPAGFPGSNPDAEIPNAGAVCVFGPPAVGKTTWARRWASERPGAVVYDLNEIAFDVGLPRYGRTMDQDRAAIAARNLRILGHLENRHVAFIADAPTQRERFYWLQRFNATSCLLTLPRDALVTRVNADPARSAHAASQIAAIDLWLDRAAG